MASRLLGRDVELALLARAIEDVQRGHGRTVLLSGEAGIGKSRLAAEALALADGFTKLEGQAHPLRAGLAYAPIVEAVRRHLNTLSGDEPARLLEGLTDLGRLMADPRLPAVEPLGEPELERTRMFEAVIRLIGRLAEQAPVLLFIDDLHWADRGTIELLHYIGHRVSGSRVLVLGGYRPSETTGALTELAVATRRARPDAELEVGPLADSVVAALVGDLLEGTPPRELLRSVTSRAKGVPLFVTALVQGAGRTALRPDALPTIVRDIVLGRLQQLDDPERQLMELVAVAGDTGTTEILREAWSSGNGDFLQALRKLHSEGLLVEQAGARHVVYRVAHPLYAEVAYAELTVGERRRVHATLVEIIDRLSPDDVFALAPHYRDAGDLVDAGRAIEVMSDAGWRALAVFDAEEAEHYLLAAVEAARESGREELMPALLDGLGLARQGIGRLDAAAAAWNEGAELAVRHGMPKLGASLHHRLSLLESERGNAAEAHAHARSVPAESLDAVMLHVIFAIRHGDPDEVQTTLNRLMTAAEEDPSDIARSASHYGRALASMFAGDFRIAHQEATLALEYGKLRELEEPVHAQGARRALVGLCLLAGDIPGAIEHAKGNSRSGVISFDIPSGRVSGHYSLATAYYVAGDLNAALRENTVGVGIARRTRMARSLYRSLLCRSLLLAEQGKLAEARECVAEAKQAYPLGDASTLALSQLVETIITVHSGLPAQSPPYTEWALHNEQLVVSVWFLYAGLSALAAEDAERATATIALVRDLGRTAPFLDAIADRLDGLLAGSPELLNQAAERFEGMGARLLAAQSRLEWAELTADRDATLACLTTFQQAGAQPWADRAKRQARALGVRIPTGRSKGTLSARERQVVDLVGEGLSNAEIAGRLFLSERTVETHLRNSYAKVGLTSRVALARWSAENN
jgi:DNA-binding NarL/FixJ family response regulator